MWATDFDPAEYQARAAGETFLPVSGPATHSVPYTVFSSSHLIEFLNEQLLVFLPRRGRTPPPHRLANSAREVKSVVGRRHLVAYDRLKSRLVDDQVIIR